jgi:hypothetical protein
MIGKTRVTWTAAARRACAGPWVCAWMLAAGMTVAPAAAAAAPGIDRQPGVEGCAEAATFAPDDQSAAAQQARRRCRLEMFDRKLQADQMRAVATQNAYQGQLIDTWMQKQLIPARLMRRNAVDVLIGTGLVSYGVAIAGVLLPNLEGEAWFGRRSVSAYSDSWSASDTRNCFGGQLKWLFFSRGNVTPFAGGGVAFCSASLQDSTFLVNAAFQSSGAPGDGGGDATAHLATGTAGLSWTDKSGFRASIAYVFAYAFYTQARTDDAMKTENDTLRNGWTDRLSAERHGVRFQVGYAF